MPTTTLNLLKTHPAQMRTVYDLDALAALTLQIVERGLNEWQPIVAASNPGLSDVEGGQGNSDSYHIVSGHRRHMAQLLALAVPDWLKTQDETDVTLDLIRMMLTELIKTHGSLEATIVALLEKHGTAEIPFVLFEGSQKAEILALQAANYGSDQPDMLGVAHSFRQAVEAGATEEEIGRNCGQPVRFVRNHLALTHIPPELAQRIAAGELPLSVATTVADLPEPKRTGLAIFILANPSAGSGQATGTITAKAIKECATTLKQWPGLQMPLLVKHQSQRNIARALVGLWGQVIDAYPEDAYAAAAMLIYRHVHEEPWAAQEKLTLWFQALGGDTYFTNGRINWTAVARYLITEVDCNSCPIRQLPQQALRSDLSQGQGGPLGMPCRVGQSATRCIHGLAENDSFDVRVPWEWSEHPGVVGNGGEYRVKSYENLLAAWQAQAAKEAAEDEAIAATVANGGESAAEKRPSAATAATTSNTAPPTLPSKDADDGKPSPVVKQRSQIADFMKRHEQYAATHPFATACGRCRHRLESSPTKDESVPHCAWAGRLRRVTFNLLQPEEANQPASVSLSVPVCRQFAPGQPWTELIPAHPEPPGLPRRWLKEQLLHLVKDANRHGSDRNSFEFLTGRPMGANENYGDWFEKQLETQGGDLSDAQLFTLLVWAYSEWRRAKGHEFTLPVNGHGMQFSVYRERPWPQKETV